MIAGYPVGLFEMAGNKVEKSRFSLHSDEGNNITGQYKDFANRPEGMRSQIRLVLSEFEVEIGAILNYHQLFDVAMVFMPGFSNFAPFRLRSSVGRAADS